MQFCNPGKVKTLKEGHMKICQLLIETIDEKNPRDIDGNTPLHIAAERGNFELCNFITQCLDDKNPANNCGVVPKDIARKTFMKMFD